MRCNRLPYPGYIRGVFGIFVDVIARSIKGGNKEIFVRISSVDKHGLLEFSQLLPSPLVHGQPRAVGWIERDPVAEKTIRLYLMLLCHSLALPSDQYV
jgi:hypothetical protein